MCSGRTSCGNCPKSTGDGTATLNAKSAKSSSVREVGRMAPDAHTVRHAPQSMQSSLIARDLPSRTLIASVGQARMQVMQPVAVVLAMTEAVRVLSQDRRA